MSLVPVFFNKHENSSVVLNYTWNAQVSSLVVDLDRTIFGCYLSQTMRRRRIGDLL